jgi:hypothetical protein
MGRKAHCSRRQARALWAALAAQNGRPARCDRLSVAGTSRVAPATGGLANWGEHFLKHLFVLAALVGASIVLLGLGGTAAASSSSVVYNNIPSPQPGNVASEAFEAQSASEFGGQIQLAGTARTNPTVTVLLSSWGCQTGHWYSGDCSTTPGATFSEPITLNVYNVGSGGAVGASIRSVTQTFNVPYRPSADNTHCTGSNAGEWYSAGDNTCYNGFATPVSFSLSGTTLPDTVIVSVAFNTTHSGS